MNSGSTQTLILNALSDYGLALLGILGAVILIGVGYLVFRIGWGKVKEFGGDPRSGAQIMADDERVWLKRHRGNHR